MEEDKTLNDDGLEDNETSYEDESQTEEATETTKEQDEQGSEGETVTLTKSELKERDSRVKKEQDKRWKERIANLEGKEGSEKSPTKEVSNLDDNNRLRLEMKGVENTDQQDFVMKYAKMEGMSIAEALNDDIVSAKLEKLSGEQEKSRATNSPINRTGKPREKTGAELAREAETKGTIPSTKEGRRAAIKALQNQYGRT